MGGRIAEEIFLSQMSTGAGNDIERATELARKMVCEWGMSDLGRDFGKKEEQIFWDERSRNTATTAKRRPSRLTKKSGRW